MVFSSFWEPSIITNPTSQGIGGEAREFGPWNIKCFRQNFREKSPVEGFEPKPFVKLTYH